MCMKCLETSHETRFNCVKYENIFDKIQHQYQIIVLIKIVL